MIRDIELFGGYSKQAEEKMLDDMETVCRQLFIVYERDAGEIRFFKDIGGRAATYTLKARPLSRRYELSVDFPYNAEKFPKTAAWYAETQTRKAGGGTNETLVYSIRKSALVCTGSNQSVEDKEKVFLELLGKMERAIRSCWAEFDALASGRVPDAVVQEARESIYPVLREIESCCGAEGE